ncbi:hypothetical protein OpiT1DRAFT_00336 [Opitutaceae bacterium TAV1]|nr:hypothetical protein OpiT1DRAFT_00336 [Opitutaceae bacterium TAV1]
MAQQSSLLKKLFVLLCLVVALVVVGLVVLSMYLGPIIKKGVNTAGPRLTGTRVELESAKVSPLAGGASLKGLFVGNPEGWKSDKAFYLGEIRVRMSPASLLGDVINIEEIYIDQPEFVYEKSLTGSNIKDLLAQIEKNTGGTSPAETPAPDGSGAGPAKKFIVKSFRLQNAKVTLALGDRTAEVSLPTVSLNDLGVKEGGITSDQLASTVLKKVLADVTTAAVDGLANMARSVVSNPATAEESVQQAKDNVKKGLDDAKAKARSIFGGSK